MTIEDKEVYLGSAELRVKFDEVTWFAAPDLIYHYVTTHHYRPPDAFIEAVLNIDAERGRMSSSVRGGARLRRRKEGR